MKHPSLTRLFVAGAAAMAATLGAMAALPHRTAVRWQSTQTEAYARLGWVYQRIHQDPTPIDIAFIGTSHTMNGINGAAVHAALAERGRCLTVANLAIPQYGRNLHWAITRELLGARRPRLIVLEVDENESRKAHPLFYRVARSADLAEAPALFNQNYLDDLIRLPWRQSVLAAQSLAPGEFGLKPAWNPADYDGSDVDNTRVINVNGQALTPPRTRALPAQRLIAEGRAEMANKQLHMLPRSMAAQEYAVPNTYVRAILSLADATKTPVLLLYLPGYGRPAAPMDMALYTGHQMLSVNDLLADTTRWYDVDHLNAAGAAAVSQRVGAALAAMLPANAAPGAPCGNGYAPRAALKPFQSPRRPQA